MTLFGPDGSRWQENMKFGEKPDFLKWRASRATTVDWTFDRAYQWAKANKVPFGAYHFPYPLARYSAADQAATLAKACPDTSIPVAIDWESDGNIVTSLHDALAVIDAIRRLGYRVPTLYTGSGYWVQVGSPNLTGYGLDLWRARYGTNPKVNDAALRYLVMGGDAGNGWDQLGGLTPTMWQFGSQIWWGDRYMDRSAIRRPRSDLGRWFQTWVTPDPTPIPPDRPTPQIEGTDMAVIAAKQQNSPAFWYSPNGGASRVPCRDMDQLWNISGLGLIDAKTHQNVNGDWTKLSVLSVSELERLLGPEA